MSDKLRIGWDRVPDGCSVCQECGAVIAAEPILHEMGTVGPSALHREWHASLYDESAAASSSSSGL